MLSLEFWTEILQNQSAQLILNVTVFGICLIIALYHFVLYFQRREDSASLYFALFCAGVALRQWLTADLLEEIGLGLSLEGFIFRLKGEYLTIPLIATGGALFINAVSLIGQALSKSSCHSSAITK